ncbi:transposase [Sinorhizobium meliloti]|uniref:transposase n=1 Tax=Rhizobium meliloti TaxID=382 RepID=UPI001F1662B0|nr:transposase [Sinorhizobium meliloti]
MIEAVPERLEGSPRQLRRFWSDEFKALAVEEASRPGANISAVARQIGILPSQLFRWRRELSGGGEQSSALAKEQQPRSAAIKERVVEVVIGDVVVRAGADVDEAHLQRVIRAVRSA